MKVNVETSTVPYSCGLGLIGGYTDQSIYRSWDRRVYNYTLDDIKLEGGTGYNIAAFIEGDELCQQVYEDIKKHYKIVFQSEVRRNNNSGNKFFFVVFDEGEIQPGDDRYIEDEEF